MYLGFTTKNLRGRIVLLTLGIGQRRSWVELISWSRAKLWQSHQLRSRQRSDFEGL